ncbi:hypothetical protein JCM9279_003000 [Rhodotorula babjevae]
MSSTDAHEQPLPFDRLPNELLAATLAHLDTPIRRDSHWFDSPTYAPADRDRRSALRAVCLVSKRFHADGRRLLYGQLEVGPSTRNKMLSALRKSAAQTRTCRILVLEGVMPRVPNDMDEWFRLLPGVEDLTLIHVPWVNLATVGALSPPPISSAFLGQLTCLALNLDDARKLSTSAVDLNSLDASLPILWSVELYLDYEAPSSSTIPLTYILGIVTGTLIVDDVDSYHDDPRWRLGPWVKLRRILAEQRAPRLVLLPPLLWAHGDALDPDVAREWQGLVDECARRGIALRKHDPAREYDGVVPEFMEFLREEAAGSAARRS